MRQEVSDGDETSHAVTEEKKRLTTLLLLDANTKGVEIRDELGKPSDMTAWTLRTAMSPLVERIDGEATRYQPLDEVPVTSPVLRISMRNQDDRPRLPFGKPSLPEEAKPAVTCELTFAMDHCVLTIATARFQPS